jgi:hypothetical protein
VDKAKRIPAAAAVMAALGLAAGLTGCEQDSPGSTSVQPQPERSAEAAAPAETPGFTATAADRCLPVDLQMLEAIALGAHDYEVTPIRGAAIKSADYENLYLIAMQFTPDDSEPETGIWASESLEPGQAQIIAVNGFAREYTVWPFGADTSLQVTQDDDGAREAVACLD